MKNVVWGLLVLLVAVLFTTERFSIQLQPDNSYVVFQFPRWVDEPWIDIDTRRIP